MPKPLRLFISPQSWALIHSYGPEQLGPAPLFHAFATFRSTASGTVFAAGDGVLSTIPPGWSRSDPRDPLGLGLTGDAAADRVNVYLELTPRQTAQAAFHARSRLMGGLTGFAYFGVERSSLEAVLGSALDGPFFGGTITRAEAVEMFLRGELRISVEAGAAIAHAALSTSPGAPLDSRDIGFAAVIDSGLTDPSFAYDWMRDFVEDLQSQVDLFLELSPVRWPVLARDLPTDAGIAITGTTTYPWSVLEDFKSSHGLTRAQWRTVGDNQKRIYRERLLARAGRPTQGSTEPPFEFNDRDADNVFQLEAIVEFYANFDEPWLTTAVPRPPADTNYIHVDFLDPEGSQATVLGRVVTLDGSPDLARVRKKDTIFLAADAGRATRIYTIESITDNALTLDADPDVAETTAWRINVKPVIVIIDPFGARERSGSTLLGDSASVTDPGIIHLDGTVALDRINARRVATPNPPAGNWESGPFDTVYFPSDQAAAVRGRPARTYRILSVDTAARTVTVDGAPDFGGGTSRWHIPAGLSGELPAMTYDTGPHKPGGQPPATSSKGTDHYDGAVFVVDAGRVVGRTRVTSYTSRKAAAGSEALSSVRGNRRYNVRSFLGGSEFRNYCFRVEDFGAIPQHGGEAAQGQDTVHDARNYFAEQVTVDPNGKTLIRLHRGSSAATSSGSDGCLVNPSFYDLRDALINRHVLDFQAANPGVDDPRYAVLEGKSHVETVMFYSTSTSPTSVRRSDWDDKLVATLWLIRPDERPVG